MRRKDDDDWNPEKFPLTIENVAQMMENHAIFYESLVSVRRGTPLEKAPETKHYAMLAKDFREFKWKIGKIFYEP